MSFMWNPKKKQFEVGKQYVITTTSPEGEVVTAPVFVLATATGEEYYAFWDEQRGMRGLGPAPRMQDGVYHRISVD